MEPKSDRESGTTTPSASLPLGIRFPAAHQYFRMRLLDEIFPIAPWASCMATEVEEGSWEVRLLWPEIGVEAVEHFSRDDLTSVYGRWMDWARTQIFQIADRLPA